MADAAPQAPRKSKAVAPLGPLADRYRLDPRAAAQLAALGELLACDELAPTAIRDPLRIRDEHLADALVALELPELQRAASVVDLGAGAGVPGLPLAAALSSAVVTLVEANARKCAFLRRAVQAMGLANATVVRSRVEEWRAPPGGADVVTARALARLDVVCEYAAPLLRLGGVLIAWRGGRDPAEESAAARAAQVLGLEPAAPIAVAPYPGSLQRHLQVITKTRPTPSRFPRRVGVARKRPLGLA